MMLAYYFERYGGALYKGKCSGRLDLRRRSFFANKIITTGGRYDLYSNADVAHVRYLSGMQCSTPLFHEVGSNYRLSNLLC